MSLVGIPPEQLALLPALTPPNGTFSNFENPENRANAYIAVAGIFLGLATIAVGLRIYIRLGLQKSPWWDDAASALALLCQAGYTGLNVWLCVHGVGKHMWDIRLLELLPLIPPARAMATMTEPSIGFTKLALLLLYYRLFSPNPMVKIAIILGIVVISVVYTTLMFLFIFLSEAQTVPLNKTMAVLNVLTDCYILVLPIYSVLKLFLPTKKKIGLALIFATGSFAVVMSIVGAVFRFKFADHGSDFTWSLLNVILVNQIECCIGIICACMPLFPALLNSTHLMSSDWLISMRSLRGRIFRSHNSSHESERSRRSAKKDKSKNQEDFIKLRDGSHTVSLEDVDNHGVQTITEVRSTINGPNNNKSVGGINVTTDYAVDRV